MDSGGNDSKIADAAEVLQNPRSVAMSVVGNVEQRNQWRSVSADSHIGWTKIGDDGRSDTCCKHPAFPRLPRPPAGVPKKAGGRAPVLTGLSPSTREPD